MVSCKSCRKWSWISWFLAGGEAWDWVHRGRAMNSDWGCCSVRQNSTICHRIPWGHIDPQGASSPNSGSAWPSNLPLQDNTYNPTLYLRASSRCSLNHFLFPRVGPPWATAIISLKNTLLESSCEIKEVLNQGQGSLASLMLPLVTGIPNPCKDSSAFLPC